MARRQRRLTVRSLHAEDAAAVAGWLAPALAAACGDVEKAQRAAESLRSRLVAADRSLRVIDVAGDPVGLVSVERAGEDLRLGVVVRPDARGRGLAADALELVERKSGKNRDGRFLSVVPRGDGRALYFWLRLGYRPVLLNEHGGRRLWMEREAGGDP